MRTLWIATIVSGTEVEVVRLLTNSSYEVQKHMPGARHKGLRRQYVSPAPGQASEGDTVTQSPLLSSTSSCECSIACSAPAILRRLSRNKGNLNTCSGFGR